MCLFKVFASLTRLRLLHALTLNGEMRVKDLAAIVEMKPQAVSNQLQRMVDWNILSARRNGIAIHYRIIDPCVVNLLNQGLCILEEEKKESV